MKPLKLSKYIFFWLSDSLTSPLIALVAFLVAIELNLYKSFGDNTAQVIPWAFVVLLLLFSLIWFFSRAFIFDNFNKYCANYWLKILWLKAPCLIPFVFWLSPVSGSEVAFLFIPITTGLLLYTAAVNFVLITDFKLKNN